MRSEDNDTLGAMFRYSDDNNYYRFSWDSQRNQRRLVKNENGVFTELASDTVPFVIGQEYQVEILAQGDLLEVWIDGERVFQVNDSTHLQGSMAFYSWFNTGAYFDDLTVEDLSGGAFNAFPKITSVTATPPNILDTDETSALAVIADDPDNGPGDLSYQWTVIAGGGMFDYETSATPVYTPDDVTGTQVITLQVEVSDGEASVRSEINLQVSDADAPPPGPEILSEDFTSGDLSAWSIWDQGTRTAPSNWRVQSPGELAQLSNIWDGGSISSLPKLGTYLLYDQGLGWLDYRVKFVLRSEDNDTLGAMFRYSDDNNYYRFSWDSQRNQRRLVKNENGVFTELASDTVPFVIGQEYQVEILAQGDLLEVWIDGERVFQVNDSTHLQGSIAFYSWFNTGAYFDELTVEDLSGGAFNAFPKITSVTATPPNILDIDETSALAVIADDPDNGPGD